MSFIRHILLFLTAMSTNPWSHGVASEIPRYGVQSLDQNYYDFQDLHKLVFRSANDSNRQNNQNGLYKIVTGFTKNTVSVANRRGQLKEPSSIDKIVFPGPVSGYTRRFDLDIPEECEKLGFCESVPNYPNKEVNDVISKKTENLNLFQVDKLDLPDTPDIAQRLGPQEDHMELCSSREKVMYPEALRDDNGKWHVVINSKEKPVQGFRVEICECPDLMSPRTSPENVLLSDSLRMRRGVVAGIQRFRMLTTYNLRKRR
uniref:Spatzle n=1 Tax=Antheraea pernyi TaxID=7119 RepID=A0A1C8YZ61_ANTPE|nr:spatzle [Antheraea pernyi]